MPMTTKNAVVYPQEFDMFMTTSPSGDDGTGGPYHLYHYMPWCWYGRPAEVVASILLRVGINEDYIDTASFDDAYDDQEYFTSTAVKVFVNREFGRSIADLVKEVTRHSQDQLGYTMGGKLGMFSRTNPAYSGSTDGVIDIQNTATSKHLCNTLRLTYGQVTRQAVTDRVNAPTEIVSNDEENNSDYDMSATWEMTGESQLSDNWTLEHENTSSVSDYGEVPLGGIKLEVDDNGNTVSVPVTHFRFYGTDTPVEEYIAKRIDYEGTELREITITQNLLGLDYEVGTVLAGKELTGDADTPLFLRCIKKTIDFNRLTVTSVLLETSIT